ncbi:unnamed protein product (macronuclear) [Paramecium tetraurelia]|uniref:Uncharacterized protein n=1 Tax=Paramecium tetraurelia TaxID=5888 RepID=A0E4Y2_PARTE|nr:uncharacterized protein GSPATT00023525001 [Paramecium tetraurelia]CAK90349.1 unnamed protein product [Paramecium tetraurelia]|eukprot:XP_001457746.1 hypothetical protein (macronuclear) [Paramecium tetraurelia strain d4-2]
MRRLIVNQTRSKTVAARPSANLDRINKWLQTLSAKANTLESRFYASQLSSLFNFYSKPSTGAAQEIDWNHWKEQITTEGLVDKVQKGHDTLLQREFDVERICHQVVSSQSKELEDLENELTFHSAVWSNYYLDQHLALLDLEQYGDRNSYVIHEDYDFYPRIRSRLRRIDRNSQLDSRFKG